MNDSLSGPDLTKGTTVSAIADGSMLLGHARGEQVLLVRHRDEFFAIGATCTHDGAPLADGLLVRDTVRCPWRQRDVGRGRRTPRVRGPQGEIRFEQRR